MARKGSKTASSTQGQKVVEMAKKHQSDREKGYREQSLRIHPWVCGRCGREFDASNLTELTVHHKDHNHDNNPADGSNWENLCIYCHDNEHRRFLDHHEAGGMSLPDAVVEQSTYKAFADLKELLSKGKR